MHVFYIILALPTYIWEPYRNYTILFVFSTIFVSLQISSYPGQVVPIKLKAYDELNHTSAAVFQISLNESKVIK